MAEITFHLNVKSMRNKRGTLFGNFRILKMKRSASITLLTGYSAFENNKIMMEMTQISKEVCHSVSVIPNMDRSVFISQRTC
jgi:hypothetical protein